MLRWAQGGNLSGHGRYRVYERTGAVKSLMADADGRTICICEGRGHRGKDFGEVLICIEFLRT